jgi:hypothetical protein
MACTIKLFYFLAKSNVCGQGQVPTLEWSTLKVLHLGRLRPYLQILERLARDKHPSLLQKSVNYGRKKFYSTGPGVSSIKRTPLRMFVIS